MKHTIKENIFNRLSISSLILWIIVIIVVSVGVYILLKHPDHIREASSALLVFLSLCALVFGWRQLKANHDWNRRSLTMTHLQEQIEKLREYRLKLDELTTKNQIIDHHGKYISFSDRVNYFFYKKHEGEVSGVSPDEIHEWICEKDAEKIDGKICKMSETGEQIFHYILLIINTYEEIATGVKHKIYDKVLVLDLMKSVIYKNYQFFEMYIKHRRKYHDNSTFAQNFEELYNEIHKEKEKSSEARKATDD